MLRLRAGDAVNTKRLPQLSDETIAVLIAEGDELVVNAEARRRFDEARALVEEAQHTLEKAAQKLSGLTGGSPACDRVAREAQRTHDLWRWLSYAFLPKHYKRLTLDGFNHEPFLRYLVSPLAEDDRKALANYLRWDMLP